MPSNARTTARRHRLSHSIFRPRLERLEWRTLLATITVTSVADDLTPNDGSVSLREAITAINAGNDLGDPDITAQGPSTFGISDTINFNISGAGVKTIAPGTPLPNITKAVNIDGYTQTGASVNTQANSDDAVILIQLDGTGAGSNANALTLGTGSGGSTLRGLDITNFSGDGIVVQSDGNTIIGNFVGVDPTGTTRMPNGTFPTSGDGIRIENASNNLIGTPNVADRNIASGNAIDGIHVVGSLIAPATGNLIQNNFVGVAADGVSSVGNRTEPAPAPGAAEGNNLFGIEISGGNNNTVGGTVAGARNVVGFNGAGIEVDNGGQGNIIQGNFSGVGADGTTPVGNLLHGIVLRSSNGFGAPLGPAQPNEPGVSFNLIGGTVAGAGNLVEFNGTGGIAIFGNPVSASGQPNIGNAIEGNSIFLNGRRFATASSAPTPLLGIDLTNGFLFPRDDGLTPNDSQGHGAPNDPNNFQNFPVLTSATVASQTTITGTLKSAPNSTFRIEFFASDPDPLGLPAEGQQFLGFVNLTTDGSGFAPISATVNAFTAGQVVTATATDPLGNTSEFSPPPPMAITVTGTGDTVAIDGVVTLREAILSINAGSPINTDVLPTFPGGAATDVINFNISAGGTVQTINVTGSTLPTITTPVLIDGYSETSASVNTLANADNAVLLIELNGTNAGANSDGLTLGAGSAGSTIRGLVVNRFAGNGIVVQSDGNTIVGNFIGVDPTGTTRAPNGTFPNSGNGVQIVGASNNQIGSTNPADRNIVSGNALVGIHIVGTLTTPATGNTIQGNFVGVAADGKSSVGNRTEPAPAPGTAEGNNLFGIEITGGNLTTIGGTAAAARNIIGFNGDGIELDNGSQHNIIQGNYVGVGADGVTPAANLLHGIALRSSNGFSAPLGPAQANEPGVSSNLIGGTVAGAGNLVKFNGTGGIAIFGNPVSASGQANVGNAIEGNSIFKNGRIYLTASSAPTPLLGIDLTNAFLFPRDDRATPNDSQGHGAANDPNNFQNSPALTTAIVQGTGTIITGTLHADPNKTYRIELFANDSDSLGLPAEGQEFLGFVSATTNGSGDAMFSTMLSVAVNTSRTITATATDPVGNTSEFSAAHAAVLALPVCDIPTLNTPSVPGTAVIQNDPNNPGSHVLVVTGTLQSDSISIQPRSAAGTQIRVKVNDRILGVFDSANVQRIVAIGLNGNDRIAVSGSLSQPATIFGDSGNDTLIAGSGNTQISGGVGNDRIFGGAGNDTLCGDAGNDVFMGGSGNDTLFGEAGNDTLNGGSGDDLLLGGIGNDKLDGATGNDRLYGQAGNDKLVGGTGNNILVGGDGSDSIFARSGLNILIGGNGPDKVVGNAGDDILIAGSTAYDENDIALQAILAEWTSGNTYETRVSNIKNGGGANGAFVLNNTTVFNDGSLDNLFGKGGRDWFWAGGNDKLKDRKSNEQVN